MRYFEHNPDMANTDRATPTRMVKALVTTGPFSLESRIGSGTRATMNKVGSGKDASAAGGSKRGGKTRDCKYGKTHMPISPFKCRDEVIDVDISGITESMLPRGGREATVMKGGIKDLQARCESMKIHTRDFPVFSYWIRVKEMREYMKSILRTAVAVAKMSRNQKQVDQLIKMGNLWKSLPNMVQWNDSEEDEGTEHVRFHLKVNPSDYHENGHNTLEFDLRARL